MTDRLPIHDVLPALVAALDSSPNAVLVAPPGAGKSTVAPLALAERPWVAGKRILMLAPRRLAARAAANRMAASLGEPVGDRVGYRVRMDSRVGPKTRIEVLTEGVFLRRILRDPELPDVAAVLFDEFHERSLDADMSLALALDAQAALRPDLRILPMSATLDDVRLAALLGDAPIIRSEGRMFEVATRYLGRPGERRLEDAMAAAVRQALREETGGVLAFLPGRGEIDRTAERLGDLPANVDVLPLHGGLDPRAQDAAIRPAPEGRRKVVLATSIAETSLTLPDIRIVIDSGLARAPRFDPAVGLARLVTERAPLSAVEQRRGRAGRVGPGVCYRLWDAAETRALPPFPRPEILEADLGPLALSLADWGAATPTDLPWLDPPPEGPLQAAVADLQAIGALDAGGRITAHGRGLLNIPAPPRLAHMIRRAAERDEAGTAALAALLATERGLGGNSVDLSARMRRLLGAKGHQAERARGLAGRMAATAGGGKRRPDPERTGALLAEAWPDRIARAMGEPGRFQMANGRRGFLEPTDPLAGAEWLAVADATGRAAETRILAAAELSAEEALAAGAGLAEQRRSVAFDKASGAVRARAERRLGRIRLAAQPVTPTDEEALTALLEAVRTEGLDLLPLSKAAHAWLARARAVAAGAGAGAGGAGDWPDLSEAGLLARLEDWAAPAILGVRRLDDIPRGRLVDGLRQAVDWRQARQIETEAPDELALPNGKRLRIDYDGPNGPAAEMIIQDLFGVAAHPTIAGTPILLSLLSPARRPAQTTQDLPGFWAGSYAAVRSELRGRYPKHAWPDDPATAAPPERRRRR